MNKQSTLHLPPWAHHVLHWDFPPYTHRGLPAPWQSSHVNCTHIVCLHQPISSQCSPQWWVRQASIQHMSCQASMGRESATDSLTYLGQYKASPARKQSPGSGPAVSPPQQSSSPGGCPQLPHLAWHLPWRSRFTAPTPTKTPTCAHRGHQYILHLKQ